LTEPGPPGDPSAASDLEPPGGSAGSDVSPDTAAASPRPGLRTFSLEHRVAPGLYLVGWLACLIGLGLLVVCALTGAPVVRVALFLLAMMSFSLGLVAGAGQQALERRAQGWAGYSGPSPFLMFAAVVPLSLLVAVLAAFVLGLLGLRFDSPAGIVLGGLATAVPLVGLVRLVVIGSGALTAADLGFVQGRSRIARDVAAGAAWGIVLIFVSGVLALALATVLPVPAGPLPTATSIAERLADLLVAAVIAPVSEEIFFRGFATTAWARAMPRGAAILRSGLFFAFIHVLTISGATTFSQGLGFATFAFVGRLPVSIALAAIFLRRGSIYASLGLHATFNAVPILLLFST
jgi:membrane protease YdiL (CAAX protease family)